MPIEIRAIVITASDACSKGERADESGQALKRLLEDANASVVETKIVSDDLEQLRTTLINFARRDDVNLSLPLAVPVSAHVTTHRKPR